MSNEEGVKYIVQRSQNESAFKNIDLKNSVNSSQAIIYRSTDNLNEYGKYYYRLQIISRDGKISYSKIIQIIYPPKQSAFYYDNNSRQLHVLRVNSEAYQWRIFDASGKTIFTGRKTIGNKLIDLSGLPGGQYIIRTFDENSIDQTYKFIK